MSGVQGNVQAIESLRTIPLFSRVTESDLASIASLLIERRIAKHKTIVEEGLTGDYMYVISSGRVKVTKLSGDGREKILEMLGPGDFFGEMALLDDDPRSASVKALSDLKIYALSRGDFLHLLKGSSDLCLAVITELTKRLRAVDEQASSLSFQGVKERTVGLLTRLAKDECGSEGRLSTQPLTHQQIADMIGTSRETVTRAIKGLKASGWLEQNGKRYLVRVDD
jgi:CRP/FNR family cyclic AMP-dependent transcriptional regulator